MSVRGKTVLITGATGSIGRRLVDVFRDAGSTVALCVRHPRDVTAAEQLAERGHGPAIVVACDLRHEGDVVRMVHRVVQRLGRIDVVVNAASIVGPRVAVAEYPIEPWRNVITTNLTGTYLVCREVLPWMVRQGSGSIINVTSSLTADIQPKWGAYLVSASGIDGLTRLLAAEAEGSGVRVNTVEIEEPCSASKTPVEGSAWPEAFLWLAGNESANTSGERIRAAGFSKTN